MRDLAAEAGGTFAILAVPAAAAGLLPGWAVALLAGLAVALAVAWLAPASGAHLNPAVSAASLPAGQLPPRRLPHYLAAQAAGATCAVAALAGLGNPEALRLQDSAPGATILLEALATLVLMSTILAVRAARSRPLAAGAWIGLAVAVGALAIGDATGAALNPARVLAAGLAGGAWSWSHLAGTLAGAFAAVALQAAAAPLQPSREAA